MWRPRRRVRASVSLLRFYIYTYRHMCFVPFCFYARARVRACLPCELFYPWSALFFSMTDKVDKKTQVYSKTRRARIPRSTLPKNYIFGTIQKAVYPLRLLACRRYGGGVLHRNNEGGEASYILLIEIFSEIRY